MADNEKYFRDILGEANRANVSFYPIDPRGLPAMETDINEGVSLMADKAMLQTRLDSMRVLASNTDGVAFLDSNDLRGQMRRLAADFPRNCRVHVHECEARWRLPDDQGPRVAPGRRGQGAARLSCRERRELTAARSGRRHASPRPMTSWTRAGLACARRARAEHRTGARSCAGRGGEPVMFRRGPSTGNVQQRRTAANSPAPNAFTSR